MQLRGPDNMGGTELHTHTGPRGSAAGCAAGEVQQLVSPIEPERQIKDMLQEMRAGLVLPPHPNLVKFVGASCSHASGAASSPLQMCVIFDLIDGLDVEALYRQNRSPKGGAWRPPMTDVLRWAEQLFSVLAFLHSHSPPLIHRDVKPGNVMVTTDLQQIKLVDFGLVTGLTKKRGRQCSQVRMARAVSEPERGAGGAGGGGGGGGAAGLGVGVGGGGTETVSAPQKMKGVSKEKEKKEKEKEKEKEKMTGKTGSFRYMAPEVMLEQNYDCKVDVYSGTMLLWYLLMGDPPFKGIEGDVVALMVRNIWFVRNI